MLIRGDDNWRMTLNLPVALTELPKINLQKIFKLLFQNEWLNRETIADLDAAFPEISDDLKALWNEASITYQREYKLPKNELIQLPNGRFTKKYSPKELRSIKANNKRLMDDVKAAKREYEHFQDRIALWNELKEKYHISII